MQVGKHVRAHRGNETTFDDLPDRETQWALLLEHLGHEDDVAQVGPGRIEVRRIHGARDLLTVLVTPDQWERVLLRHGLHHGAHDYFTDLLGPKQADETFLVCWEDDLVRSTRAELPPVRGTAVQRRLEAAVAAARAKDPDATFGWYAYPPGSSPERG
jgi:hypothetical protein